MPKIAQSVSMTPAPENGAHKSASIIVFDEVYPMLELHPAQGDQRSQFHSRAAVSRCPLGDNWLLVL
jgi:hypothetical protein